MSGMTSARTPSLLTTRLRAARLGMYARPRRARSPRRRVAGRTRPESLTTRETVIGETAARRATSAMVTVRDRGDRSVVQHRLDLGIVDIGLVVPVVAGVDVLGQRLALDCLDRGIDALVADADRILGNRAGFDATAHRVG